jgi:hypothetical protein
VQFPRLYSFVKNKNISVMDSLAAQNLDELFHLPLSEEAFLELQQLQDMLVNLSYDPSVTDSWVFIWSNSV